MRKVLSNCCAKEIITGEKLICSDCEKECREREFDVCKKCELPNNELNEQGYCNTCVVNEII